jgi:hypothetical protein
LKTNSINKRLAALEARTKPRLISTLADFAKWCAEDESDEVVEFSPQMQDFVNETFKHIEERRKASSP